MTALVFKLHVGVLAVGSFWKKSSHYSTVHGSSSLNILPYFQGDGRATNQALPCLRSEKTGSTILLCSVPSWSDLELAMSDTYFLPVPTTIDSVLQPAIPNISVDHPTLFRERHGWCPYSERVWLTLELLNIPYHTILIDNTGGPRPSYFSGRQTPQVKWPNGQQQGESLDLVDRLDSDYQSFDFQSTNPKVKHAISQFRNIFPSRARPSSRAAFLFQSNGQPLFRSTFENTLLKTEQLLAESDGSFFAGEKLTAADIAWAPFLERYRYQLPCLHVGLCPDDPEMYPQLSSWYQAMDQTAEYACRVKGTASSWRKVLLMSGFGNAGMVPQRIIENIKILMLQEEENLGSMNSRSGRYLTLWREYAASRPYVASTPQLQVAQIICRNRNAILQDTIKQQAKSRTDMDELPSSTEEVDETMRELVQALIDGDDGTGLTNYSCRTVGALASFLVERMCVPRDMGAIPAASLQYMAWQLQTYN